MTAAVIPHLFIMHCLSTYCALSGVGVGNASSKALFCETYSDALTVSFSEVLSFFNKGTIGAQGRLFFQEILGTGALGHGGRGSVTVRCQLSTNIACSLQDKKLL